MIIYTTNFYNKIIWILVLDWQKAFGVYLLNILFPVWGFVGLRDIEFLSYIYMKYRENNITIDDSLIVWTRPHHSCTIRP